MALVGALLASSVAVPSAHAEPAAISGTITSQATGAPLEGCVEAYTAETWDWAGFTCTDGSGTGTWAVDGLDLGPRTSSASRATTACTSPSGPRTHRGDEP